MRYYERYETMKHLLIVGVGGLARETYWSAKSSLGFNTDWDIKGFLDGDVKLPEAEYLKLELPVMGDINSYRIETDDVFVCAIGDPTAKMRLTSILEERGACFINLIHETAIIHGCVELQQGCIVFPWVSVHDHAKIGKHVLMGNRVGIAHDCTVGDYSCLMGSVGLCGNVQTGKRTYWADGALALPNARIGDDAYVGVRSVVFKRVKAGQTVFGNPALPIPSTDNLHN